MKKEVRTQLALLLVAVVLWIAALLIPLLVVSAKLDRLWLVVGLLSVGLLAAGYSAWQEAWRSRG